MSDYFTVKLVREVLFSAEDESGIRICDAETGVYYFVHAIHVVTSPDGSQGVEFVI